MSLNITSFYYIAALSDITPDAFATRMIGLVLYCGAVFVALLLFMFYRPPDEEKETGAVDPRYRISKRSQSKCFCILMYYYYNLFPIRLRT